MGQEGDREGGGNEDRTYRMVFPVELCTRPCPSDRCSVRSTTRTAMPMHFWHQNVRDTMVILEEGNLPHPGCSLRDMLVTWRSLNGWHQRTAKCKKGVERKLWHLVA